MVCAALASALAVYSAGSPSAAFGAEVPKCSAHLFTDSDLNTATSWGGPLTIGIGRHDLLSLVQEVNGPGINLNVWLESGLRSAIVSGIRGECVLSLYEHKDLSGWRVDLGPGLYTTCFTQANGVPWQAAGFAHVGLDKFVPSSGSTIAVPRSAHTWKGPGSIAHIDTFRFFELSFMLQAPGGLHDSCNDAAPLLELFTTGYTTRSEFFNASNEDSVIVMGTVTKAHNHIRDWMISPIMNVWLFSPKGGKSKGCRLAVILETRNFPESDPIECWGSNELSLGRTATSVNITYGPDRVLQITVGGSLHLHCGPSKTSLAPQRHVKLYLGSRYYNMGPPSNVAITQVSYRLVGPLGAYGAESAGGQRFLGAVPALSSLRIPRIIHQVWLGDNEPQALTDSWRAYALFCKERWEHWFWNSEETIANALFKSDDQLLRAIAPLYVAETSAAGRSDFLRFALLYAFGGVYIDADAAWLGRKGKLDPYLDGVTFLAGWEDKRQLLIATGVMASEKGGAVVRRVLEIQLQVYSHCRLDLERKPWDPLALGVLTNVITSEFHNDSTVRVIPYHMFYPEAHHQDPWRKYGRSLTDLQRSTTGISVDLGLGTNNLNIKMFSVEAPPRKLGHRTHLVHAWQQAVIHTMSELFALQESPTDGVLQYGSLAASAAWGSRMGTYPKVLRIQPGLPMQLMIVSHADDESLFGGVLLLEEGPPWLVVVVTMPIEQEQQHVRKEELSSAMRKASSVVEVRLLGFPECSRCAPFHPQMYDDVAAVLEEQAWRRIVTHGPLGEYGHPQHRELSLVVASLVNGRVPLWVFQPKFFNKSSMQQRGPLYGMLDAYVSQKPVLDLFRFWVPNAVPQEDFNASLAREMCRQGANSVTYYLRTCTSLLWWPRSQFESFLTWEAHAYALQHLAHELSQTAEVGLYGVPLLRRFAYVRAAGSKGQRPRDHCGCIMGAAAALAWLTMSTAHTAMVLPVAGLLGRVVEDVTSSVVFASNAASRLVPIKQASAERQAEGVTQEILTRCGFLLGPAGPLLDILRGNVLMGQRSSWKLVLHGNAGEVDSDLGLSPRRKVGKDEDADHEMLLQILAADLYQHGWTTNFTSSSCLMEDSHERLWSWSRTAQDDVPDVHANSVEWFACWLELEHKDSLMPMKDSTLTSHSK